MQMEEKSVTCQSVKSTMTQLVSRLARPKTEDIMTTVPNGVLLLFMFFLYPMECFYCSCSLYPMECFYCSCSLHPLKCCYCSCSLYPIGLPICHYK
ncbi:hypothetical protein CEXT_691671 [Caerostris extrusa]|uniref:Uncharacterized protein n=1 Tax=Caerostris extrusa TaxID=172846 RepID=A0AAV4SHC9_CAEEX|nr:hypothetical protein CEXT_691671 [Caerostris extrusa]